MSWSLAIANGDLSLGSNGMNTVTSGAKLVQDLSCCILEPMGTDDMHPSYGSIIDGGMTPDGVQQRGVIGQGNNAASASFVQAEIQRICTSYQSQQVSRNATDVVTYGNSTLTAGEALLAVSGISIQTAQTAMLVTTNLITGGGTVTINTASGS